jgi:hypothetical protein
MGWKMIAAFAGKNGQNIVQYVGRGVWANDDGGEIYV